jgi:hypothetical protein
MNKKDIYTSKYEISMWGLDEEGQFCIMLDNDDNEHYIELFATDWLTYGNQFKGLKNGTFYQFKKEVIRKFLIKGVDISEISGLLMKELKNTINALRDKLLEYYFDYEYNEYTQRSYKKSKYSCLSDICVYSDTLYD